MTPHPTAPEERDRDRTRSYILLVRYTAELAVVDTAMPAHRRFLDQHFASGEFLVSGPRDPRIGGVIVARVTTKERLDEMIARDPFVRQGLATYQVIGFRPTRGPFARPLGDPNSPIPGL